MEKWSEDRKKEKELEGEIVDFLRKKNLSFGDAIKALKDAQEYLERVSLKNKI